MSVKSTDSSTGRAQQAQKAAAEAEADAQRRITVAQRRVREAELQAADQINEIKDHYSRDGEIERARQEVALEQARAKGYEVIREAQQGYSRELSRIENQSKDQINQRDAFYRKSLFDTEKRGTEALADLEQKNSLRESYQRKLGDAEFELLKNDHQKRMTELKESTDSLFAKESGATKTRQEGMRESLEASTRQLKEHHEELYEGYVKNSDTQLGALDRKISGELKARQNDGTRRLDAYSERSKDPFYQLLDLGAKLEETDDGFILRARIPEHERNHVSVSVRGNQLVLSGHRSNDDSIELQPGQTRRTSSHQAYTETFPLTKQVEPKELRRRFEGDQLIIEIPKKGTYSREVYQAKKTADRVRAERPRFPENLPIDDTGQDPRDEAKLAQQNAANHSGKPLG